MTTTPVYFFSRHKPSDLMIEQLKEKGEGFSEIAHQFEGTIANLKLKKDEEIINFNEILEIEGKTETFQRTIPKESVVVVVAPITLQITWLETGVKTLLIPESTKIPLQQGGAEFVYTGLLEIKKIEIQSERFAGEPKTVEQILEGRKLVVPVPGQ